MQSDEETCSKQHLIDRIIDGDWRRGLSLYQHATIDFAHLSTNDTALRWSALRIVPLESSITASLPSSDGPPTKKRRTTTHTHPIYPTTSPHTFLATLRASLSPLLKSTYHLTTLSLPHNHTLPIIRLYLSPTVAFAPRSANIPRSARHATDGGRVMYIALPPSCPYIYVSLAGATASATVSSSAPIKGKMDITSMKRLVIEAIPKALSRPHERWALESTKLTARSLKAMCELRGAGRPGTAGGVGALLCPDDGGKVEPSPVDVLAEKAYMTPPPEEIDGEDEVEREVKRKRTEELDARFGPLMHSKRAKLDRVAVRIEDVGRRRGEERSAVDTAQIGLTFAGADVHAGLRALAELGVLDVNCMPGWMAGSEAKSMISV